MKSGKHVKQVVEKQESRKVERWVSCALDGIEMQNSENLNLERNFK